MYAVIKTGGKQYRVANGDILAVEKLDGDPGSAVALAPVLMLDDDSSSTVGTPVIEGATVSAEILEQARGDKIIVFKKKRRQGYRRKKGHRQDLTVVRITDVTGKTQAVSTRAAKAADATPAGDDAEASAKPAAKKAAPKKPAAKKPAAKKPAAKRTSSRAKSADKE